MLPNVQEVSITYLFLNHRHQRIAGHVAEIVLGTCPNWDFYFLIMDIEKQVLDTCPKSDMGTPPSFKCLCFFCYKS